MAVMALVLTGASRAPADDLPLPATEQVLLGAPDPAGPTSRGVFLADPQGQIEHLVGIGHLVAWTVRTPADTSSPAAPTDPRTLPATSRVVIVDERGGAPLTVDYAGRWIHSLHPFRGPAGAADPRLAVRSCRGRKASGCKVEVLTLTPNAPVTLKSRSSDRLAAAANQGRIDSGQRLVLSTPARRGKRRACLPRLSIRTLDAAGTRNLPKLPGNPDYPTCNGVTKAFLHGRYVFAEVSRLDLDYGVGARFLYGFDLGGGGAARWHQVQKTASVTEFTDALAIGPGVTDSALFFETYFADDEGTTVGLTKVELPLDVQRTRTKSDTVSSDPISFANRGACTIAATDDAIYELTNPRCSYGPGVAGEIRRVVNPEFTRPG